jgi:hypothetical protein
LIGYCTAGSTHVIIAGKCKVKAFGCAAKFLST